jgi:ABC-type nickel/cobalt efflux system permease component RcnA
MLDSKQGLALLLLLAAGFGAVHALTPGHGKTLVAAYLVGERGTVWHAVLLGLTTTLTHTAAVLVLAVVLLFVPSAAGAVQAGLGIVGGLCIAAFGLWLLYTRATGRADHVHLGGGHHHHGHGHDHDHGHSHGRWGHHHHHDHDHDHGVQPAAAVHGVTASPGVAVAEEKSAAPVKVGWWRIVVLGMYGGAVPCGDAIVMLVLAVSANRLWLALPLLLAFSAGLAGVLVALGVGVVFARNFAGARWGGGDRFRRVVKALPLVSAVLITGIGLWLCYASLHPAP